MEKSDALSRLQLEKRIAAQSALKFIESDMIVGIGTGSTVSYLIEGLHNLIQKQQLTSIKAVCSSVSSEQLCNKFSIPITSIDEVDYVDVYIDGADEVLKEGFALKGLGGALTREKILAKLSKQFVIIADSSKVADQLGGKAPICIEVLRFGHKAVIKKTLNEIKDLLSIDRCSLRLTNSNIFITDNGNVIYDIYLSHPLVSDPKMFQQISTILKGQTGIIELGLFTDQADHVMIGYHYKNSERVVDLRGK